MHYSNILVRRRVKLFCNDLKKLKIITYASGNIMLTCVTSLMMVCILFCIMIYCIRLRISNEVFVDVEDSVTASCMAGLSIDIKKFHDTFITGKADVVVESPYESYSLFKDTLKLNLNIDSNDMINNLYVRKYIIYNISYDRNQESDDNRNIDIYEFDENGIVNEIHKKDKFVYAPNGIKIVNTSVFADVYFNLKIWGDTYADCHKQFLTQADKR